MKKFLKWITDFTINYKSEILLQVLADMAWNN
jgi:hypothetical protein